MDWDRIMYIQCKLVILILVLALDDQVHTGEIIGGDEVKPHSRPYMVLLERKTQSDKPLYCGGFLLNEDFVMTAAHCKAESYTVFLGVHNVKEKDKKQNVSVNQTFPHEGYKEEGYINDIMLLRMSSKANFSNTVETIDLAGQGDGSLPKSCIVSGWGATSSNTGVMSFELREANVTLIGKELCKKENSYCSQGDIGPGVGDSGGPLVCEDGKAYGVVSSKTSLDDKQLYYYAKIPHYRSWIDSVMKNNGKL